MTRWMWGAVLLAGGCVVVEDDDKGDTGGTDTDTQDTDTGTGPGDPDDDGDGFPASTDCNDADAAINPNAPENCDGIDNNCNTTIDDEFAVTLGGTNYATVDEALAAAVDGDTLEVCPGTFELAGSIAPAGSLTLHSVAGRDATSLAVTGGAAVATVGDNLSLTLDGFTLSGSVGAAIEMSGSSTVNVLASRLTGNGQGFTIDSQPPDSGTLVITGTDIDTNDAGNGDGGGISAVGSFAVSLSQSNLTGNNAANGGAIFARVIFGVGTVSLVETVIDGNTADIGGGVVLQNVTLTGDTVSTISNNSAVTAGGGVAMYMGSLSSVLVSTNNAPAGGGIAGIQDDDFEGAPFQNLLNTVIVDSNTADMGAGIWVDDTEPMTIDAYSAVTLNTATTTGGGAYLDGNESSLSSAGANFGAAGTDDNAPDDIFTAAGVFPYEPGAVFTCTGGTGCEDAPPPPQ